MRMITVDLRSEAIAEVRRLKRARALLRNGDQQALVQLDADGTWIARARRARLRRTLSGRLCLVWRVAFEEPSGRAVDSMLVSVLVDFRGAADRRSRAWIESFLRQADDLLRERVEHECETWRTEVTAVASTCSSVRAQRERAIADPADRASRGLQPGLFDRRAERAREAHASAAAAAAQAAVERLRAVLETTQIARQPPRLLLVLLP